MSAAIGLPCSLTPATLIPQIYPLVLIPIVRNKQSYFKILLIYQIHFDTAVGFGCFEN